MTDKPISRFPVPKLEDMPEDIRDMMLGVQEKAGFIPNVFLTLAHRPDGCCQTNANQSVKGREAALYAMPN